MGGSGNDILDGGTGNDNLTGGAGADQFVFRYNDYGYERILDFHIAEDMINLSNFGFSSVEDVKAVASDTDFGLKLNFGDGNVIIIENITKDDMDAMNWVLN